MDLNTGMDVPTIEGSQVLYLTECGDYLVLLYLDEKEHGFTKGIYATKKGNKITKKTVWQQVYFPDMQEGTAIPPNPPYYDTMEYTITEASECGYVFQDGYVYYLNEDWNLCSRPLFGEENEKIVYEGTALAPDEKGRVKMRSGTLAFGKDCFYYHYYTAIEEEDASNVWNRHTINYEPIPIKWEDYIRKLPK